MRKRLFPALASAAALTLGAGFEPAPAQASQDLLIKMGKRDHHYGGKRWHHRRKHHKGHRHGGRRHWSYGPWYWGGQRCFIDHRPHRVRVRDPYYGWYFKTIWRPVHICR